MCKEETPKLQRDIRNMDLVGGCYVGYAELALSKTHCTTKILLINVLIKYTPRVINIKLLQGMLILM